MTKRVLIALVLLTLLLAQVPVYAAGTPAIFSYQGRLTNASGDLLGGSGTTYYFKFSIWDVSTGGVAGTNRLWPLTAPTSVPATVRQGVFNVNIGDTANDYPDTLDYNFNTDEDIFLQIEVSSNGTSFETLDPRQRIAASPFAKVSGAVSGTGASSIGSTTPFANSMLAIEATSTQAVGLSIRGIASQLANLFQIQNSAGTNLFAVDSSGNVGIGSVAPSRKFNVLDANSTPQVRIGQTGSVYGEMYVDSAGDVQLSSTGGNIRNQDENLWVCAGGSCGATAPASKGNVIVETGVIFNNNFKFKQIDASTTIMYDTTDSAILEFDEGE